MMIMRMEEDYLCFEEIFVVDNDNIYSLNLQ